MEGGPHLPLTHPMRVKSRERKLWAHELSWAIQEQIITSQAHLKLSCPCKLCDNGYQQEKYVETVLSHLDAKNYGRDPKNYGSSKVSLLQNYDPEHSIRFFPLSVVSPL